MLPDHEKYINVTYNPWPDRLVQDALLIGRETAAQNRLGLPINYYGHSKHRTSYR